MDGRTFDSITRAFAGRTNRRAALWRGGVLIGALAPLATLGSAGAARRGSTGSSTSVCAPNGAGGYYRSSVPSLLIQSYLDQGYIVSDCCAHAECGQSNACQSAVCDFAAGACAVSYVNGSSCDRAGCVPGYCSGGICMDPSPFFCGGDGYCNNCTYDSCSNRCNCRVKACSVDDWQCSDSYCDSGQAACVNEPINEGATCDTYGVTGTCVMGHCTAA